MGFINLIDSGVIVEYLGKSSEISEIIKGYMKRNKLTGKKFAQTLGKDPAYLSRVLNEKHEISASMMLTLFKHIGYEVVIMTKKEKNLLEKEAYAALAKDIGSIRKEIRMGLINEIEHDLKKNISDYFSKK